MFRWLWGFFLCSLVKLSKQDHTGIHSHFTPTPLILTTHWQCFSGRYGGDSWPNLWKPNQELTKISERLHFDIKRERKISPLFRFGWTLQTDNSLRFEEHGRQMMTMVFSVCILWAFPYIWQTSLLRCVSRVRGCSNWAAFKWLIQALVSSLSPLLQCGWGQWTANSCHSIVLLQARFWWRALSHVYSCTGSKRGQQHNGSGQLGCSTTVWETPSHTKESKQRHRRRKKNLQGLRKL